VYIGATFVTMSKFYVVWKGRKPGVYNRWADALAQIHEFPDATYKSFGSLSEADTAFADGPAKHVKPRGKGSAGAKTAAKKPVGSGGWNPQSISVDAACSGNPGDMEYRGVFTADGRELFRVGPLEEGTNNIGEFLALVHALAWLKQQGKPDYPIYSDSYTAQLWIKGGRCKTKLERTRRNEKIFGLIERAERWLALNEVTNPIIKWETDRWGEIPADFGRKG
jgi:ribonuclease HI